MEVVLANPRGFCAGVDRAIEIVERALQVHGAPIYVRHEVVHNKFVVADLRRKGAAFVEETSEIPVGWCIGPHAPGTRPAILDTPSPATALTWSAVRMARCLRRALHRRSKTAFVTQSAAWRHTCRVASTNDVAYSWQITCAHSLRF